MKFCKFCILFLFISIASCDVYMHHLRGSNNRLNENTATRANGNRLFDSQNNARGGYNVGDQTKSPASSESQQYRMAFFQSGKIGDTEVTIEWTNQHGCGGDENTSPHKLNCNLVLQFMCQKDNSNPAPDDSITFRNGQRTATQDYTKPNNNNDESKNQVERRRNGNVDSTEGLHESWEWYDACYRRERNKGLFTADQQLNDNNQGVSSAIFTRQSPDENRYGYECPEERDYYPYFHPTPWIDVAVFAHNDTSCSYYEERSFNTQPYGECVEKFSGSSRRKHWSTANNPEDCVEEGGEWTEYHSYLELAQTFTDKDSCLQQNNNGNDRVRYMWGKPYEVEKIVNHDPIEDACFVVPPPLDCKAAEWSRVNHLGNGRDLTPLNYTWILPHYPSNTTQRCVFRLRYNISTDDYDPFNTNASYNEIRENNVVMKPSPIEQNPLVDVGARNQPLRLAINTDQTGRVFQDRSHVFILEPRSGVDALKDTNRILNLNVRGKRGNIVQVYPAVEYDFIPNRLEMNESDLLYIQWTGSNTHNNNAPGGDGQTGDAGEGTDGTDRSNLVQMLSPGENYPVVYENATLFKNMKVLYTKFEDVQLIGSDEDIKLLATAQLASSGYFKCATFEQCKLESLERKNALDNLLNDAPASFAGLLVSIKKGNYYYMCTRNNNFSNRSQKGQITVR